MKDYALATDVMLNLLDKLHIKRAVAFCVSDIHLEPPVLPVLAQSSGPSFVTKVIGIFSLWHYSCPMHVLSLLGTTASGSRIIVLALT
jgi:hypothetical protein